MNDQFSDKEIQIITAAFQEAAAAASRLQSGVWDLNLINDSITKSGIAMGTLNAILRMRDLNPAEWEAHLEPGGETITVRLKHQRP
jgi:hypothetical protein